MAFNKQKWKAQTKFSQIYIGQKFKKKNQPELYIKTGDRTANEINEEGEVKRERVFRPNEIVIKE